MSYITSVSEVAKKKSKKKKQRVVKKKKKEKANLILLFRPQKGRTAGRNRPRKIKGRLQNPTKQ